MDFEEISSLNQLVKSVLEKNIRRQSELLEKSLIENAHQTIDFLTKSYQNYVQVIKEYIKSNKEDFEEIPENKTSFEYLDSAFRLMLEHQKTQYLYNDEGIFNLKELFEKKHLDDPRIKLRLSTVKFKRAFKGPYLGKINRLYVVDSLKEIIGEINEEKKIFAEARDVLTREFVVGNLGFDEIRELEANHRIKLSQILNDSEKIIKVDYPITKKGESLLGSYYDKKADCSALDKLKLFEKSSLLKIKPGFSSLGDFLDYSFRIFR